MHSDGILPIPLTNRLDSSSTVSLLSNLTSKVLIEVIIPEHEWKFVFRVPTNTLVRELLRRVLNVCHLEPAQYTNYGFYLPPCGLKKGKYLQEERLLGEYPQLYDHSVEWENNGTFMRDEFAGNEESTEQIHRPSLWLIQKCRYVSDIPMGIQKFKQANSRQCQKLLISAIRSRDIGKMEILLNDGLDPNFQYHRNGDTPIGLAAIQPYPKQLILKLVEHGAHLDYRDTGALTALHWAVMKGNLEAIKTLLELGLNPNVRDSRGLTPLYRAVSRDVPTECISMLLYDHAILGVTDDKKRQEIHQACLFDHPQHLEQLIIYGADLNSQTYNLDTPLHICALNNHVACLRLLLRCGAKRDLVNSSGQTPYQVALLTGLSQLAAEIDTFASDQLIPVATGPVYNACRKPSIFGPRGAFGVIQNSYSVFSDRGSTQHSRTDSQVPAVLPNNELVCSEIGAWVGTSVQGAENMQATKLHRKCLRTMQTKVVTLRRGNSGFGFQVRGQREPIGRSLEQVRPANQYFDQIYPNSAASDAGLSPGDYIIEVNGVDVRNASHHQVTDMIVRSGTTVTLRILTNSISNEFRKRIGIRMVDRRNFTLRRAGSLDPVHRNPLPQPSSLFVDGIESVPSDRNPASSFVCDSSAQIGRETVTHHRPSDDIDPGVFAVPCSKTENQPVRRVEDVGCEICSGDLPSQDFEGQMTEHFQAGVASSSETPSTQAFSIAE